MREQREAGVPIPAAVHDPRPIILVVDDDKVVHLVISRALQGFHGTVLYADNGATALAVAMKVIPDLVITDALMPGLDGRELARAIKTTPETSRCTVAVMTGLYKGVRYRAEAIRDFQVDEYLEKPVRAEQIRTLVASVEGRLQASPASALQVPAAS
jgi:CheY-like chemotaxis protein